MPLSSAIDDNEFDTGGGGGGCGGPAVAVEADTLTRRKRSKGGKLDGDLPRETERAIIAES